jgi:peptidoglycan hydrolase CwlO-like protein
MAAFQATASTLVTAATNAMSTLTTSFTTLSGIEGSLQTQIAGLQGQIGTAKGEMEATQKRYYYLLALGPFGLVGLSAALALYLKWKSDVSSLQGEINSLNGQIASLQSIVSSCKALAASESQVLQDLINLKNAIDSVCSDFTAIQQDLAGTTDPTTLQTVARAADAMLVTLEADAS